MTSDDFEIPSLGFGLECAVVWSEPRESVDKTPPGSWLIQQSTLQEAHSKPALISQTPSNNGNHAYGWNFFSRTPFSACEFHMPERKPAR